MDVFCDWNCCLQLVGNFVQAEKLDDILQTTKNVFSLDILFVFWLFLQWSLVRKYATSQYPNQLWPNLVIHICLTRPQWAKGFVRKTWSLYISRLKTDFPVKSREYAHFPMIYSSPAVFLRSLSPNHSLKLLKYVQTGLHHHAGCNSLAAD